MARYVTVEHQRTFHHPLDQVYAWLTDYEKRDAQRAGAVIVSREVVSQDEGRIALDEVISSLGLERSVRTVVELDPPDAWRARVHHTPGSEPDLFEYQLEPLDDRGCRLTATYRYAVTSFWERLMLKVLARWIDKEIQTMWSGFANAMDRELTAQAHAENV